MDRPKKIYFLGGREVSRKTHERINRWIGNRKVTILTAQNEGIIYENRWIPIKVFEAFFSKAVSKAERLREKYNENPQKWREISLQRYYEKYGSKKN